MWTEYYIHPTVTITHFLDQNFCILNNKAKKCSREKMNDSNKGKLHPIELEDKYIS